MIRIEHPASIIDVAELSGARTEIEWEVAREMHRNGETWAAFGSGDALIGLFGLYPLPAPDAAEAWFNVAPAAAVYMREIIRGIRLTLASASYAEIEICCQTQAGRRIAALSGFEFVETIEIGEIWKWAKCSRERAPNLPSSKLKLNSAAALPNLPSNKATSTRPRQAAPASARADVPC